MTYKVTAIDLKLAVLEYYRFRRQYICVDECHGADVIADNGKEIIEIEVKITKSDLINGERKKLYKHKRYKQGRGKWGCFPNKFLFCVPEKLVDDALCLAHEINEKYGVIAFDADRFVKRIEDGFLSEHGAHLRIVKSARRLHENYSQGTQREIARRASASLITVKQSLYKVRIGREAGE